MLLTDEQIARIQANMEARIKRAEALVAKIAQVNASDEAPSNLAYPKEPT